MTDDEIIQEELEDIEQGIMDATWARFKGPDGEHDIDAMWAAADAGDLGAKLIRSQARFVKKMMEKSAALRGITVEEAWRRIGL